MRIKGIQYFPYCHYFLTLIIIFFFITFAFFVSTYYGNLLNYSSLDYYLFSQYYITLASIPIGIFPIFIFGVINKKAKIENDSWKRLWIRLSYYAIESFYIMIIFVLIAYIIVSIISLIIDPSQIDYFIHNFDIYYKIPTKFFNNIFKFNINDSKESTLISLAGYYFSLAIGGTVILSVADRYFEEKEELKTKLKEQRDTFNGLYSEPELRFYLSQIITVNIKNINFKKFNFEDIIKFNTDVLKNFSCVLSKLRKKLECEEIENKRITLLEYKKFIRLIVVTYIFGFLILYVPLFLPERVITLIPWIFMVDSYLFGRYIYKIYQGFWRVDLKT